jgi:hypothetical protein
MGTEARKFARRDIDLAVEIETVDGSSVRAILMDLSRGGARLKVKKHDGLPEQFTLKLSDKLRRNSRLVWRSTEEIGVEFLPASHVLAGSKPRRSVLIKCPRTGRDISTGIRLTAGDDLRKLSDVRRFAQCPCCKVVHGWMVSEASLTA